MPKLKLLLKLLCVIPVHACAADTSTQQGISKSTNYKSSTQLLPPDWKTLTHKDWLHLLSLDDICRPPFKGPQERFKFTVDIESENQLLLLACELGAYQDGYRIFNINAPTKTIVPLLFDIPVYNQSWRLESKSVIWGGVEVLKEKGSIILTYLSSATGACGYVAHFPVQHILSGEQVSPSEISADNDCYNGVTVDGWPKIEL